MFYTKEDTDFYTMIQSFKSKKKEEAMEVNLSEHEQETKKCSICGYEITQNEPILFDNNNEPSHDYCFELLNKDKSFFDTKTYRLNLKHKWNE